MVITSNRYDILSKLELNRIGKSTKTATQINTFVICLIPPLLFQMLVIMGRRKSKPNTLEWAKN